MQRRGEHLRRRGPFSTISPAYITSTWSAISATTGRLWVMNSSAIRRSRCRPASNSSTCAWIVTSSAVVGSSAISRRGLLAMAIAIIARWRMPPDISCGKARARRSGSEMPTRPSNATARRHAAARRNGSMRTDRLGHLGAHPVHGVQAAQRVLEHHRHVRRRAAAAARLRAAAARRGPPRTPPRRPPAPSAAAAPSAPARSATCPNRFRPTIATVSPGITRNDTSRTGRIGPPGVSISTLRPRTSTTGPASATSPGTSRASRRRRSPPPTA